MLAMAFSIGEEPSLWTCSLLFFLGIPNHAYASNGILHKEGASSPDTLSFLEKTISFWGARSLARENWVYTPKNRNYGKQFWPTLNPGFKGLPT
jgi:hypothetical protein